MTKIIDVMTLEASLKVNHPERGSETNPESQVFHGEAGKHASQFCSADQTPGNDVK